jgi:hypothetical protein
VFAKSLERILIQLCTDSDVSGEGTLDISGRFESLRSYALLPRGRENRAKALSSKEIAAAILGLAPTNAKWAGHAAKILGDLRPVGGVSASFREAPTLSAALETILTKEAALEELVNITFSTAEIFTNSHGLTTLIYEQGGTRKLVSFVSKMALTLMNRGAEQTFDHTQMNSHSSRSLVLNQSFFSKLKTKIETSKAFSQEPEGDGSEYDEEEARRARLAALGVKAGSRFLNLGVDTQATWPRTESLVPFDKYQFVLMPKTREHTQSIHIDTVTHRIPDEEAKTAINRFLSILAWCTDQHAVVIGGWSGSPTPMPVPRKNLAFATAYEFPFQRSISKSDEARRALALYRDGLNSEEAGLAGYAVLSYVKIIEIRNPQGDQVRKWLGSAFQQATANSSSDASMEHFLAACGSEGPVDYIWKACRLAVAHASEKHISDILRPSFCDFSPGTS